MKKHIHFFLFVLFVSCTPVVEQLDKPFSEGQEVTISATIGEQRPQMLPSMQRVSGKDTDPTNPNNGTIHLTWDEGDKILVTIGDKSSVFNLTSGVGTGSGTFTGIMPAEGASFHVQYPTNIPNLAEQQYVKDGFGKDLMLMTTKQAATVNSGFVLSADYALLGLQLTGDRGIGKIVLSKNNADGKAGDETYTLHCPGVTLSATPTLFYIVVLPNTWENGFTVDVFGSDNSTIVDTFVKTTSITFDTTNATVMPTKPVQGSAKRIGVFSVGDGKYVSFSQGNLQYIQSQDRWQFAENQWEYIGANNLIDGTLADKIDLLGWSGEAGVSFLDWGTNVIQGEAANTWRTLSTYEWKYLLHDREHATELLVLAMIANALGLVLLPDEWICPDGIQLVSIGQTSATWDDSRACYDYSENIYLHNLLAVEIWQRIEQAGAVFLPAGGYINKDNLLNACGMVGRYWSSTPHAIVKGYYMSFGRTETSVKNCIYTQSAYNSDLGHTVRLVHDTIVPPPAPCQTIEVNGVTFKMMCVEGGTFMMGSDDASAPSNVKPAHQVTLSDFMIGQTEVTRKQWNAVMGNVPNNVAVNDYPIGHITWEDCQVFIQKLNQLTGLLFRLPTEAEWEYAARGGQKSRDCIYSGSDDPDKIGWTYYLSNGTQPVAQKLPNELGIYDMTGNSWEWCMDGGLRIYGEAVDNPIYEGTSTGHVIRGGSFRTVHERCSNIARSHYGQNQGDSHISLRLVLEVSNTAP